jgi:hypothetical protein
VRLLTKYASLIFIVICTIFSTHTNASLITNVNTETVSYSITTGDFGWRASYDIGFVEQDLLIDVDVFLTGDDPGNELLNIWEQGIENIWSYAFDIFDGTFYYDIIFNIDWLSSFTGSDHTVNVTNGSGNVDLVNWYTDNPSGHGYTKQSNVAAHEFGHMVGLFDEYNGGALDPITPLIRPNSIMGQNLTVPKADHFDAFLSWASLNSGVNSLSLESDRGNHYYEVPTPNMALVIIMAILSSCIRSRKRFHNFMPQVSVRQI